MGKPKKEDYDELFEREPTPTEPKAAGENLILEPGGKVSGKAWGRVWQFVTCQGFPYSVFFIVGNEFCERFSYYGMRAILVLYLTYYLGFNEDTSTALYHTFIVLCYATPLLGAIIADSLLGKFKTIIILSIVYAIGNIVLSLSAMPPVLNHNETAYKIMAFGGLGLIALGTGGIKPCVAAFGGDQFREHQMHLLSKFFSIFYFSINAGSLISTLLTPVLRGDVSCFGGEGCVGDEDGECGGRDCYALAFGIPAILMIISLVIFLAGSRLYIKNKPPGGDNIFFMFFGCLWAAIKNKIASRGSGQRRKFIHYACPQYSEAFANDVWAVLRVLVMFLPLPVFWSLFDQQGSRWTLQATRMNGDIGGIHIKPDQMQALNAILILVFIPFFEVVVYPILNKLHLLRKPLQRMVVGMLLAGLAFMVAGFIQLKVQGTGFHPPVGGEARITFTNVVPDSSVMVEIDDNMSFNISSYQSTMRTIIVTNISHTITVTPTNESYNSITNDTFFESQSLGHVLIGLGDDEELDIILVPGYSNNTNDDEATVRYIDTLEARNIGQFNLPNTLCDSGKEYIINRIDSDTTIHCPKVVALNVKRDPSQWVRALLIKVINGVSGLMDELTIELYDASDCEDEDYIFTSNNLMFGEYQVFDEVSVAEYSFIINATAEEQGVKSICGDKEFVGGGVYSVIVTRDNSNFKVDVVKSSEPDSVSLLLQIPMYVLITAGEIMFSITGLEFAYSQAPASMKSICQAGWLLTVCVGNIIDAAVTQSQIIENQAGEFFFFASLIGLMAIILAIMSLFYKYVPLPQDEPRAKKTSDEETLALVDSSPGNYDSSLKTDTSEL